MPPDAAIRRTERAPIIVAILTALAGAMVVAASGSSRLPLLAVVGGTAFAGGIWACGNPRLACLWGLGLSAPLNLAKRFHPMPHMGGAGAYSVEAVDLFILALIAFQLRDAAAGAGRLRLSPVAFWYGGMIALGLFSTAFAQFQQLAFAEVVQMAKTLAMFIVLVNELVRVRLFLHLFAALCGGLLLQSLIGILQYAKKGDLGLQVLGEATMETLEYANKATYGDGGSTFRIGALMGHPNIFAGFIILIAPMLFAMLMARLPMEKKLPIGAVLGAALLALLLTLSRSGWMAFALSVPIVVGCMLWDHRSRRRALAMTAVSGVLGLFGALAAAPAIMRRFTESDPGAVDFRWEWMGVAWQMVKDNPLFGVGLNSFVFQLPGRSRYGGTEGLNQTFGSVWPVVHDVYLLIWAEQGTLGFACFIGLLACVLWTAWRNTRACADPLLHALNVGALAGICANIVDGFGSFYLRQMPGGRMFWISAAIIFATRYWHRANRPGAAA